jgi:hypothetical protein
VECFYLCQPLSPVCLSFYIAHRTLPVCVHLCLVLSRTAPPLSSFTLHSVFYLHRAPY